MLLELSHTTVLMGDRNPRNLHLEILIYKAPLRRKCSSLSCILPLATSWTMTRQSPLSMDFSRQEYWSGLPFPSPGRLPDPGIKPRSLALQVDSLPSEPSGKSHNMRLLLFLIISTTIKNICQYIILISFTVPIH